MGTGDHLIFSNVYFGVDSRVYVIDNDDLGYTIKSIYKYEESSREFGENFIADWKRSQGFSHYSEISSPNNRIDLKGTNITVSYVVTNPDTHNHLSDYR